MIVHFVDIVGIVEHHCLIFLFIIALSWSKSVVILFWSYELLPSCDTGQNV